jgi:hypothetical protein
LADIDHKKKASKKVLIVTLVSTLMWVASLVFSFVIKPADKLVFIPDALLLLGFFPLLWLWRRDWLTFLFGLFNGLIGFFLVILQFLPDEKFTGAMQLMRTHLLQMHSSWTWLILGVVAMLWAAVGMSISLFGWVSRLTKNNRVKTDLVKTDPVKTDHPNTDQSQSP